MASSPCGYTSANADPANETLPSALSNLINDFYGNLTKTVVNGRVTWELPCDLDSGLESNPRLPGEGTACYLLRLVEDTLEQFPTTQVVDGDVFVSGRGVDGSNLAGGDIYVRPGPGTGTGALSSLFIQAPVTGSSGTADQSFQNLVECKADATAGADTSGVWLSFWNGASWVSKRVLMGAPDSAGVGYRTLRVAN